MKAKTQSILSPEDIKGMATVAVRFDDCWQLVFEIERIPEDKVALFLPGAPDPWAGMVCVVTADRVTPLDVSSQFRSLQDSKSGSAGAPKKPCRIP